jgi:hypothetical protein
MTRKKAARGAPVPYVGLRRALDRITQSEVIPSVEDFLELGREVREARLDYFLQPAFLGGTEPKGSAFNLTHTSCCYYQTSDEQARLKYAQDMSRLLADIKARPGFWLYVRDEFVRFSRLVREELRNRTLPQTSLRSQTRRGRRSTNADLLDFDENERRKNPNLTDKEVLTAFRKKRPNHPIFESADPEGALRAARSRRRKRRPST